MYKDEDEKHRMRVEARNDLENYIYNVKGHLSNEAFSNQFTSEERKTLQDVCKASMDWLDQNPSSESEHYEQQRTKLQSVVAPILARIKHVTEGQTSGSGGGHDHGGHPTNHSSQEGHHNAENVD